MVRSNSTPINRRAAQENAAVQEQARAANLAGASKADSRAVVQTLNQLQMTPKGERDAAWIDNYNTVLKGKDAATRQGQYFNDIATKPIQDNYATPTNDLELGYNPSNLTIQNNQLTTNNELMGLDGKFNASAIKRLRATGMSDADIKKTINGLKPSIKETMSNTGLPPVTNEYLQKNNVDLPFGGSVVSSQMGANGNPEYILSNGLRVSASAYDQESVKANAQARNNAQVSGTVNGAMTTSTPTTPKKTLTVVSYIDNPDGTTTNTLSDGTTSTVRYTKNPDGSLTPTEVGSNQPDLSTITANVPPEYKPFVDYYLNQAGNTTERTKAARDAAQTAVSGADSIAEKEAEAALVRQTNNEADLAAQKQLIEDNKVKQEKFLAEQKQIADDQIALEEAKVLYDDQAAKKQSLFEMTNALALSGGFSSGNGLAHIQSTKSKLDEHTEYITKSYGIEKRKLINDFKASYLQVEQQADSNMQIALQNYKAEANAINAFSLQSQTNKINSKTKAVQDFSAKVDEILKDRDTQVGKAIDISMGAIKDQKENERVSQDQAFTDLKWYKSNYGSNLPAGVVEDLQKKLPNLNVSSFLTTETLAEKKASAARASAARVSGAWAATFRPTELKSDGSMPSFDEYLAQRKQDEGFYKQSTSGVVGPQNMLETRLGLPTQASEQLFRSRIQKEYDAKVAEKQKYSIQNIDTLLAVANSSTSVPAHTKKDRVAEVNKQINNGDYVAAYDYVAGLGSQPSSTERETLSKAINARENVKKIKEKFAALGPNIGPVYGRARELNLYDTDIVEIQALIKGTVPGVARGIFGEVGVLTNEDVENYTKVMANPRLTAEQAMLLTNNLLETIDHTVKSKLDIWTASGVATKRLYELYESGATKEEVQNFGITPVSSYTQSLLQP